VPAGACAGRGAEGGPPASPPAEGSYVTDGASLFRVVNTIRDERKDQLLLELEDCKTLELLVCPADAVVTLALETVVPAVRAGA
jgi:hypothetical protein